MARHTPLIPVDATTLRAHLADAILATPHHDLPTQLGEITLAPHQHDAARRLLHTLHTDGGALLADDVGLGKTYTALAIATRYTRPVVVTPATLRHHWRRAMKRAHTTLPLLSLHQLSRTPAPPLAPDLVVIDEAHHLRTPTTTRYHHAATLCAGAHVLLLSATPIHNRPDDLTHLFALGCPLDDHTTATHTRRIVRRTRHDLPHHATPPDSARTPSAPPTVHHAPPLTIATTDDTTAITHAIDTLPLPPAATHAAHALVRLTLHRAWASSGAALLLALRQLRTRLAALADATANGTPLDHATIARRIAGPDTLQLDLLDRLAPAPTPLPPHERDALRTTLDTASTAITTLLARATPTAHATDDARATLLRTLRDHHAPHPIIAFAHAATTIRALGARLLADPGTACCTAHAARIASGPIPRDTLLRLVAPHAHHAPTPHPRERVRLLLTTDLLGEGLDLTDCAAVVHLDLAWTPARLAQRVGRIARLGSPHHAVTVYTLVPPVPPDRLRDTSSRLARKRRAARLVTGPHATPRAVESLHALARTWQRDAATPPTAPPHRTTRTTRSTPHALTATQPLGAHHHTPHALALLHPTPHRHTDAHHAAADAADAAPHHPPHTLLAFRPTARHPNGHWSDHPRAIARTAHHLHTHRHTPTPPAPLTDPVRHTLLHTLHHWLRHHHARQLVGAPPHATTRAPTAPPPLPLGRIDAALQTLPFTARAARRDAARTARDAAAHPRGIARHRALATLLRQPPPTGDPAALDRWLAAITALGDPPTHSPPPPPAHSPAHSRSQSHSPTPTHGPGPTPAPALPHLVALLVGLPPTT